MLSVGFALTCFGPGSAPLSPGPEGSMGMENEVWRLLCSAHFQLITQGERARLQPAENGHRPTGFTGAASFSPVQHLSGCNINPSLAPNSPLHAVESFHPFLLNGLHTGVAS